MAYVAISTALVNDVDRNLHNMYLKEMASQSDPNAVANNMLAEQETRSAIMDKLWEPVADIRARLEQYGQSLNVRCYVEYVPPEETTKRTNFSSFTLANAPCIIQGESSYYGRTTEFNLMQLGDPRVQDLIDLLLARKEIEDRWEKVRLQVKKFLQASKSLNEAVKLWPDVRRYIPDSYLKRVDQKAEKKVREESAAMEALKAIDLDAVNASTVLARMAGAQV